MGNAGCPRCGSVVSLHESRPFITSTGVELWHRTCFDVRDQPLPVVESAPVADARQGGAVTIAQYARPRTVVPSRARFVGVVAAVLVVGVGLVGWATAGTPAANAVRIDVAVQEATAIRGASAAHEIIPPRVARGASELIVPTINGEPLDRVYPSLRGWIHPVAAANERLPELRSRRFGSERHGIERSECGAGHCGIDLDGPRGRPIVSVAAGTVVRVERSELGADGKSGRYVRLEHDDGTLTAYMHMDDVAELRVGDRVDAGQYLGTLGATAVYAAPPHLHFSLEIPEHAGVRGDHSDTEYVDPAPFLARARVSPVPEGRTPKPAF